MVRFVNLEGVTVLVIAATSSILKGEKWQGSTEMGFAALELKLGHLLSGRDACPGLWVGAARRSESRLEDWRAGSDRHAVAGGCEIVGARQVGGQEDRKL